MKTINFISKLPCLIKNHALREIFLIKGIIVNDAWLDSCFDYSSSTDGQEFWTEIRKGNYKPYYEKYGFPDKWKIKILPEWIQTQDWNELGALAELINSSPKNKSIIGVVYLQDHLKNFVGNYLYNDGQIKSPFNISDDAKEVTLEDYELYKRFCKKEELEVVEETTQFEKMQKDIELLKSKINDIKVVLSAVMFRDDFDDERRVKIPKILKDL